MLRIDRSQSSKQLVDRRGIPFTLTMERIELSLRFGRSPWGASAGYARPTAVVRDDAVTPILDLVMIVKLAGLLAVAAAAFVGELRR